MVPITATIALTSVMQSGQQRKHLTRWNPPALRLSEWGIRHKVIAVRPSQIGSPSEGALYYNTTATSGLARVDTVLTAAESVSHQHSTALRSYLACRKVHYIIILRLPRGLQELTLYSLLPNLYPTNTAPLSDLISRVGSTALRSYLACRKVHYIIILRLPRSLQELTLYSLLPNLYPTNTAPLSDLISRVGRKVHYIIILRLPRSLQELTLYSLLPNLYPTNSTALRSYLACRKEGALYYNTTATSELARVDTVLTAAESVSHQHSTALRSYLACRKVHYIIILRLPRSLQELTLYSLLPNLYPTNTAPLSDLISRVGRVDTVLTAAESVSHQHSTALRSYLACRKVHYIIILRLPRSLQELTLYSLLPNLYPTNTAPLSDLISRVGRKVHYIIILRLPRSLQELTLYSLLPNLYPTNTAPLSDLISRVGRKVHYIIILRLPRSLQELTLYSLLPNLYPTNTASLSDLISRVGRKVHYIIILRLPRGLQELTLYSLLPNLYPTNTAPLSDLISRVGRKVHYIIILRLPRSLQELTLYSLLPNLYATNTAPLSELISRVGSFDRACENLG
ncbi:hypothetical protein J6590_011291 [Homalodisca vitripennis]|nr:hypothetical protein J6590_011291 [Homalodisca vitripennis]